jgi:hypothetical protein
MWVISRMEYAIYEAEKARGSVAVANTPDPTPQNPDMAVKCLGF